MRGGELSIITLDELRRLLKSDARTEEEASDTADEPELDESERPSAAGTTDG